MQKRSMFSKILGINIISILISLVVFGSTQMILLTSFISRYSESALSKSADTVINFLSGAIDESNLQSVLTGFARGTGSFIMVFDNRGNVVSCSADVEFVESRPKFLNKNVTRVVLSGHKYTEIGTLDGLFKKTMFTLQVPINDNNKTIGAVSISRPIPEHQKMQYELFKIMLLSMLILAMVSLILSYFFAKSISIPLKKVCDATKKFAKGDYSVRADSIEVNSSVSEISELTEAFNNMAEDIEKSEEIKNAFISDVSHELRTPMTTISGFVSGMLDGTIPTEKRDDYLKIVYDEVNRLSRLVNTFLDITRLQSDKVVLNKTNFDINEVIRIVIIGLENKIEEKKN